MQGQQTMQRSDLAPKKPVFNRPPRLGTAPTPPLSRMPRKSLSNLSSSSASSLTSATSSSSDAQESESGDPGSESSSELQQESDMERPRRGRPHHELVTTASDQLSELPCKQRQQHHSFTLGGTHADPKAEPPGLVWQDSGFMVPFTPEAFVPKRGQSRQISTAATGVTSVLGRGKQCCCTYANPSMYLLYESSTQQEHGPVLRHACELCLFGCGLSCDLCGGLIHKSQHNLRSALG